MEFRLPSRCLYSFRQDNFCKIILKTLIFFLPIFSFADSTKTKIVIGIYELAPHVLIESQPDGKSIAKGAIIDFINTEMKSKKLFDSIEIRLLPFARVLEELASGKIDMAVSLAKNPERELKYRYFSVPFTMAQAAVILKATDPIREIKDLKVLSKKVLGHVVGSVTPDYLAANGIRIDAISGDNYHERNLARLRAHRIDGFYVPTYSNGRFQLSKYDKEKEFKILKLPVEEIGLYFAFRKDYPEGEIKKLENAFPNLLQHYEEFLQKYY